ncbi:restriction endonuclease subunit S [Acinetobacter guillouiae]|uniref:restriction endonuclease subunit S n=1 Tax=Acinetobacter guillouiae TaxID=106649 RepID=UPI003AF9C452
MAKYDLRSEFISTNVEGIQSIPKEWRIKQVRYLLKDGAEGIKIGPFGSALKLEDMVDDGFSVYGQENVIKKDFSLGKRKISETKFQEMSVYRIFPKDILITMMGTSGKCEIVPSDINDGIIDSHLLRVRVKEDQILPEFFKLLIDKSPEISYQIQVFGKGSIMHGLNSGIVKSLNLPLPSIEEQKLILNFLDHETAQIDTLIAKQEKMIELLKEKRQVVISHAVTKGLNPYVAMKDSGVEWLGEVPEHWEVRQLRYLGSCQNGINIGAEYFGSGSSFISYSDVYRNPELPRVFEGLVQSTENDKRIYSVQSGDVLFTRTSETIEEIGFSSTCLTDVKDATFAGFLIRFRPIQNTLLPEYSKFYFRNILLRAFFVKEMNLVTRASLSQELLKKLAVPFPSLEEQKQIADFLSAKERVFDKLVNDCIKQIELLKERRTALISAAVTGKIDVRNWQSPDKKNNQNNMEFSA